MVPRCDLTCNSPFLRASISLKSLPEPTAAQGDFPSPFPAYPTQTPVITQELTQLASAFLPYQSVLANSCSLASMEPPVFAFLPWPWRAE